MFRLYWVASHGATKSYLAWREQQQPRVAQVVHTHQTLSQHGWLRGFGTLNYSPCSWIFTFVSVVSSPLSYLFSSTTSRNYTGKCSHHTIIWHKTYFEISTAQLHSVTEITPPQTFLCVNTSPIRYNFRVGAKAFCYSVNIALVFLHSH